MYNGPCHLHAPPLVAFISVSGLALLFTHFGGSQVCHPILTQLEGTHENFDPGGLRAPCVLACAKCSLAIVITIVQSFSPLSSYFFSVFCF